MQEGRGHGTLVIDVSCVCFEGMGNFSASVRILFISDGLLKHRYLGVKYSKSP